MGRDSTLNDPLSGAEIKEIIRQKVSEALDRDCTLVDDHTYPGFHLKFEASIGFVRSTTPSTMIWGEQGTKIVGGPDTSQDQVTAEYQTDSPNTAREENNLPMPVMIQTPSGPKREKVPFTKPGKKHA
jgi:hypothetical protein